MSRAKVDPDRADDAGRHGEASDAHHRLGDLTEVLGALDELADDADALNARIQALLDDR